MRDWLDFTQAGANNLIRRLVQIGLLKQITGYGCNRRFRLEPYLLCEEPEEEQPRGHPRTSTGEKPRPQGSTLLLSITSRSWGMTIQQLLKEKREEILRIAAKHGARNVRVFGSVARGEADEQSDLDLLVEFEPGRSLMDHAALWLELQELLGCKVDVVSDRGIKPRIRDRVLREAVPL